MVIRQDIERMFDELGITPDSTAAVHTSLKSIGMIDGGAEGLLDYYTELLSEGLLIVPTHTCAVVNRGSPVYDVRETVPNIGVFPQICAKEAFRRENAVRSLHPTHSVAAFGRRAEEFVKGEENTRSRTPVRGVWGRFYEENAKVLMIGVGLERNTYMHSIDEEFNPFPENPDFYFDAVTIGADGRRYELPRMNTNFYWMSADFPLLENYLRKKDAISYSTLGGAKVTCFDVRKGHDALTDLCKRADNTLDFYSTVKAAEQSFR